MRPTLFDPHYLALQAWVFMQLTAEKPVPSDAYQRKLRQYVDSMLNSKDIRPEEKKLVIGFLAGAEEKSSKVYTARSMLERSIAMNPNDMDIRLQLGELEERAGRFAQARKIYEDALGKSSMDSSVEKKLLVRILRVYALFGDEAKLTATLKKALAQHPRDPYFRELAKRRLPASVKKQ